MLQKLIGFYRPAPFIDSTKREDEEAYYKRLRWSVFLSATFGYGLYYVCRLSFNVIKKPLIDQGLYTESQLGIIGSTLFFSYACAKFINGFLADRSNIRKFMVTGLVVSACINICLGFGMPFIAFAVLWGLNGWAQSMGAPPSVIALTRWFSTKQRGTYYGFWSASHNIGEALTYLVIAFLVASFSWQTGFFGAGIIGLLGVIIIWFGLHDSPESKGLASINIQNALPEQNKEPVGKMQLQVLKNPFVWILALSSSCMYITRYAVNSWGIFFLEAKKGYTGVQASSIISINAVCGIVGTVLSGFISDKFFRGNRRLPALIFGLMNTLAICIFTLAPKNFFLDSLTMVLFGLSIGVLVCFLGGLMAVDIAPKKATGAALGIIGIASYIGAGIQDVLSGSLIEKGKQVIGGHAVYDFSSVTFFWIGGAIASFVLALLVRTQKQNNKI